MSRPISPELYEPSWQEPAWVSCPTCRGNGTVRDANDLDVTCPRCDGDGEAEL